MRVDRSAREHGGVPVKWLGDGVMVHFRDPDGAVLAALQMVEQFPAAGLPPAHVGVAAGPVVVQGGDYYGRTVNLAARIAARAGAGRCWSASVWSRRPRPGACALWSWGRCGWRGLPVPCGCWRPAGRRRLPPQ
jgi:class 3 adenylate cyclase